MKKTTFNSGTTIVELILYMGLLSIFIVMVVNLFGQVLSVQTNSVSESNIQTNGNYLLIKLAKDINSSDGIITPSSIGQTANSIVLKNGLNNTSYTVVDGRLVLTDSSGTYNLNDVDTIISDFLVKRLGNSGGKNGLQISYKITSTIVESETKSATFNTFISLR